MADRLRVLIVEDDEADAELTCHALERGGFDLVWLRVDSADALRRALDEKSWDVVISDFAMPSFDGLRAFAIFLERRLDIPFIFVSGALGEERAVEAMRAGAHDYLLKGALGRLAVAIRREMRASSNRRQKTTAEESSRRHQRRLGLAVEVSGVGVFESHLPPDERSFVAERCMHMLGYQLGDLPEPEELQEWVRARVHPEDLGHLDEASRAFVDGASEALSVELRMRHRLGHWLDLDVRAKAFAHDHDGRVSQLVGVVLDLTERKRMEGHLRQKQKMEAIGSLAGGIAHDFNNLLTAIASFGTFVLEALEPDAPARADMEEVLKAGSRAAALTNQLLAFSRLKRSSPRDIVAAEVVTNLQRMLRRLLGEDIAMTARLGPAGLNVRIDPAELEQVLVNLTVNARDAMPDGGRLDIELLPVMVEGQAGGPEGAEALPGEYVLIAVSDTGIGMDAATQARIFDPFFTTKEPGRGTGLGLATCYGIVHQAGGFIAVESEVGRGSTFKVYLPRTSGAEASIASKPSVRDLHGSGTILVVEDDEPVRELVVRTLARQGYRVLQAANGHEALAMSAAESGRIAVLLSDVVMPGLSGRDLAAQIRLTRPDIEVLFMSGYSPVETFSRGDLEPDAAVIQKPFTPDALAREVRAAMDRSLAPKLA